VDDAMKNRRRNLYLTHKRQWLAVNSKRIRQRASRLEIVNQIGSAISSLQSLEHILRLIFEQIQENIQLDVFYIALYNEKTRVVSFPILYDGGKFWNDLPRDLDQTVTLKQAIESRETLLINRSETELESVKSSHSRLGDLARVAASVIIVPLQAAERVIGALSIQSYALNAYDVNHLAFVQTLVPQVTIAIENARLYEELKVNSGYLTTLNELGRLVSELHDLPDLLEVIYLEVKKLLR
jgi:GAF domain-containing protein